MRNRRNRRSRRLETPSAHKELSEAQIATPNQGDEALTNVNIVVQETLNDDELKPQLFESQISNEIQVWNEHFEQMNNDRIMKIGSYFEGNKNEKERIGNYKSQI